MNRRNYVRILVGTIIPLSGCVGEETNLGQSPATQTDSPTPTNEPDYADSPSADSNPELFRLIDKGAEKDKTTVRIRPSNSDKVIRTYTLNTTGSQHFDMQDKSLEETYPYVAEDINSFDDLPPGKYVIEVENDGVVGQETFMWGETSLQDGNVIKATVMWDGCVRMDIYHSDPGTGTPT